MDIINVKMGIGRRIGRKYGEIICGSVCIGGLEGCGCWRSLRMEGRGVCLGSYVG